MPACNIYNEEHKQLLVNFFDTVTAEDMVEQAALLASNAVVAAAQRKCISFAAATGFGPGITPDKIQEIVNIMAGSLQKAKGAKTALVAPGEEALSIALMFEDYLTAVAHPGEVKIFTSKDEAVGWLGGGRAQWCQMRDHIMKMCSG